MKRLTLKACANKVAAIFLALTIGLSTCPVGAVGSAETAAPADSDGGTTLEGLEYQKYLANHSGQSFTEKEYVLTTEALRDSEQPAQAKLIDGTEAYVVDAENTWLEYAVNVDTAGLYNILLAYYPLEGTGHDIQLGFMVDGVYPYAELENVGFSRIWVNENGLTFKKDEFGNEARPTQVEAPRWNAEWVKNSTGIYEKPYAVYLTEGEHMLRVVRYTEAAAIASVTLAQHPEAPDYAEYLAEHADKETVQDACYVIEAEDAIEKNDNRLAATIDSTNAGMSPASYSVRVVNSFGKDYWNTNGQWATWTVAEDLKPGLYCLRFRAKQDTSVGVAAFRALYINDQIPFSQAKSLRFEYHDGWYIQTAGGDEPYLFYLEPGDVLKLEATTGEMAEPLNRIFTSIEQFNDIYQSIIMVTGTTPDMQRDYNIQKEIPTLLDDLATAQENVRQIDWMITEVMGEANAKTYFFREFEQLIDRLLEDHRLIITELSTFKSYIDAYIAQTYEFNTLQLELDSLYIMSMDSPEPEANPGFWASLAFEFNRFFYSFIDDYSMVREGEGSTITVWTSLGRDQAQAVKQMIEEDFTLQTGINVRFQMSTTTLPEAILAGLEPDVSLSVTQEVPIDLALRGQVVNLAPYIAQLDDEYMAQFSKDAWIPFQYEGGIYAMPITQDFNMMFYRSDILGELGLKLPETWDEFYEVLRELQKNNMQVGMREADSASAGVSTAINVFDMFLLQRGGSYFDESLTQTAFESREGKEAFVELVELYKSYGLETSFDMRTRFRSGEMPLIITAYSFYGQLAATAIEIQGRWGMTTVPGTVREDGTVDKSVSSTMTGAIMLKGAERRGVTDEAFAFLKWWADADAQVAYANAMESIQGIAGRPAVANQAAFSRLNWSQEEKNVLSQQHQWATAIPQIPGMYIINRSLTNALRTSYSDNVDSLRQLNVQNRLINEELTRKRAEFESNN